MRNNKRVHKRLLQFNNLPFAYGEADGVGGSISFKGETTPYTNNLHGGYYPNHGDWGKMNTSEINATLILSFKGVDCDHIARYARFIKRELARSGKLWAVQSGNEILYANARVTSIGQAQPLDENGVMELDVTFELIDGFWVIANKTRTWITKYSACDFTCFDNNYCFDLSQMAGQCTPSGNHCIACDRVEAEESCKNDSDFTPLCHYTDKQLTDMFSATCPNSYAIRYDKDLEANYFCSDVPFGKKKRLKTGNVVNNVTEWEFCSRTDIPSELATVTLVGSFENPTIEINKRKITVYGSFKNEAIVVGPGLEVYASSDIRDPYSHPSRNLIANTEFTGAPYFQFMPGVNKIKVSGATMNSNSLAYIRPVEITY